MALIAKNQPIFYPRGKRFFRLDTRGQFSLPEDIRGVLFEKWRSVVIARVGLFFLFKSVLCSSHISSIQISNAIFWLVDCIFFFVFFLWLRGLVYFAILAGVVLFFT